MSEIQLTQRDYLAVIHAADAIGAIPEVLDALTDFAALSIQSGETQQGADILAFVLLQSTLAYETQSKAETLFDDLCAWICPCVIWDAHAFAREVDLADIIWYITPDAA